MYDLPSGEADVSGTLVDLFDDEDLEMMWEELDVMLVSLHVLTSSLVFRIGGASLLCSCNHHSANGRLLCFSGQ